MVFLFCVSGCLNCLYGCVPYMYLILMEARGGYWNLWNWSKRWLWAAIWLLGIKLGISEREASTLNPQIISSDPKCPYRWVLDFIDTSSHRNMWHESRRKVVCRTEETNRQVGIGAMRSKSKTSVREMAYGTHIKQGNCNVLETKHRETVPWCWSWQWLF